MHRRMAVSRGPRIRRLEYGLNPREEVEYATRNFNMVWQNDYDVYHLVLDKARDCLRQVPGMTDQTLGRNVKDYVFALRCAGGWGYPTGMGTPQVRATLQWIDVADYGKVSEEEVAEQVRELLGIES
jgi:hypothetical protein